MLSSFLKNKKITTLKVLKILHFNFKFTKISTETSNKKLSIPRGKRKITNIYSNYAIYKFDTFDEFCSFCTYLNNTKLGNLKKFAKNISLYEYSSNYFLVFSEINTDFENTSLFYISISEFAKLASNSPCFASKLVEYGKTIFKNNAIQNGIKYFETNIN